ncbi:hypothetical protein [Herbidospora cretacea]|uniref:hypothetical protein n=1 Tax=Herbidospora cretacea TaxID=28444 RepID=UPI0007746088|nr:hypothetical protein [Herbidospora cretacea]
MNKSTKAGLIVLALTAGALGAVSAPASARSDGSPWPPPASVCDTNMHWGNEGCKGPGGGGDDGT